MNTGKDISFRGLVTFLADRIGRHQVPVIEGAHEIRGFIGCDGVHHDLISATVRRLYKANRCGHLDAQLDRDRTLTTLAAIRAELLQCHHTDIDQYRFMENLCHSAQDYFDERVPAQSTVPPAQDPAQGRGKIIALPGMPAVIPSLG
jgi:hypothetical protein